jgi:hypothetical protein
LVEPGQLTHCGARPKTDVLDCQWLQRLHCYGLLRPSFRPPDWGEGEKGTQLLLTSQLRLPRPQSGRGPAALV